MSIQFGWPEMNRDRRFRFVALSGILLALTIVTIALGWPWFAIILIALAIESFLACWALRTGLAQDLFLSAGLALAVIVGFDLRVRILTEGPKFHETNPNDLRVREFDQPRSERASYRSTSWRTSDGARIFDVTYTLDTHGHRLTKGGGLGADTYLFFGDSFTYGHGLQDNETLPWLFSEARGYRFTVANLAYSGFGPHQMLRLLEAGSVDRVVTGKVRRAYFSIIADHVDRVVGRPYNRLLGPKYVLDGSGRPVFTGGRFLDHWDGRIAWLTEQTGGLPAQVWSRAMDYWVPRNYRIDLVVAVLKESRRLISSKYDAELIVLVWDSPDTIELEAAMRKGGLHIIPLSSLIGDHHAPGFRLMPDIDGHPTGKANGKIATALAAMESSGSNSR